MEWFVAVLLAGLAALLYLLYDRGYLPVKTMSAVYFAGSMGAGTDQCNASFGSANGQIKRVLRFKDSSPYRFTFKGNLTKGDVTAFILDRDQNAVLALSSDCPTGSIQAAKGQRYYIVIRFKNAQGDFSLKWEQKTLL